MKRLSLKLVIINLLLLAGCARFQPRPISPAQTADDFDNRSLNDRNLRAFMESNNVAAPGPRDPWSLPALTLAAFYLQPSLAEARAQWAAAGATSITAGQRPNPSVSVTPGYDAQIPGNPSPWLVTLTTDWPIETAGKRGKRVAQAKHQAEAARWKLVGALWQARSNVRSAWLDLYATRQTASLLALQMAAQSNVVRLLEGQFAAGSISGYDVTQARVALDSTRLQWQQAEGQRVQAAARMAVALGVPLRALDGVEFSFAGLDQFPNELSQKEVRRAALLNRADVRGALADYAASQSSLQLEIANQYPDVHIGPGYGWNYGSSGDNEWQLGLSVTLPVMNHNQGQVAEATARRAEAAAHFLNVQANAIGEISSALAAYDAALRESATAKALLESMRLRLNSARAQAKAGQTEPLNVANAEVEFGTGAQNEFTAVIKAQAALGQLEDAMESPMTLPPATIQAAEKETVRQ